MGSLLKDSVASFFKIMIDPDFLTLLYLPPKFACTTPHLLNKKTYLENLNEQRWNVVVSKENGSLAFRKGWLEFSTAHNLGIGDLVVFHYFRGQYFLVQVFNKSACDLRGSMLGKSHHSERSRSETNPVGTDRSLPAKYENLGSQEDSPGIGDSNDSVTSASERGDVYTHENKTATEVHPLVVVPIEDGKAKQANFEYPEGELVMIRRDTSSEQREARTVTDMSNYEMPSADVKSNIKLTGNKHSLPCANTVVICKAEPDMTEFTNPEQEINCHVGFPESTKCKEVERRLYNDVKKKKYDVPTIGSPSSTALSPKYEPVKKMRNNVPTEGSPSSTALSPKCESYLKKVKYDTPDVGSPSLTALLRKRRSAVNKVKYDPPTIGSPSSTSLSPKCESVVKKVKYDAPTIGAPSSTDLSSKYESNVEKIKYDAPTIVPPKLTALSPKYESDAPKLTASNSVYRVEVSDSDLPVQNVNTVVKIKKEVKTEPFEETSSAFVTASASDLHCLIRNATALFLELPGSLPLFTCRVGESGQKLVLLRDPAERIWPVFYHHKPSMKLLTTGWPAFMNANDIQSGDEFIFKADTGKDATYDVSIVRKKDRST